MDTGLMYPLERPPSTACATYNSMHHYAGKQVESQVASLLYSEFLKIYLNFMHTQIQAGEYDCGLYAIANVTALVHMEDP